MFGMANEGRLGVHVPELSPEDEKYDESAVAIKGLQLVQFPDPALQVAKVECGSSFTLVLSSQGQLYSWGFGKSGSLGLGETSFSGTPQLIRSLYNGDPCQGMTDISCGSSHSLAVDNQGRIYSWGNGQAGRLGHHQEVGENAPRQIKELEGKFVKYIEAGDASSACITHEPQVYMWGSGLNGRLGNGDSGPELLPQLSQELKDKQVACIVKGTNTTFAIMENSVFGWGSSKSGKLGFELANGKNYELPKEIIALKDVQVYQVAAGPFHTLVLTVDGTILSMGNSKDGKLGYDVVGGGVAEVELPARVQGGHVFFCHQV